MVVGARARCRERESRNDGRGNGTTSRAWTTRVARDDAAIWRVAIICDCGGRGGDVGVAGVEFVLKRGVRKNETPSLKS